MLRKLIWITLNTQFGLSHAYDTYIKKKQRLWEPLLIGFAMFGVFAAFGSLAVVVTRGMVEAAAPIGQQSMVLTLAFLASQILALILGILFVLTSLYYSKDLSILIPLPLRSYQVVVSKLSVILLIQYLGTFPILLPIFITYGIKVAVSPLYWVLIWPVLFLAPLIPMAIATVLVVGMMRVINFSKRRDLLVTVGGLFLTLLALFGNFYLQSLFMGGEEAEIMERIMTSANALAQQVGRQFPPSYWATRALDGAGTGSGMAYFMLFLTVSLAASFFAVWVGDRVFYKGAIKGFETGKRRSAHVATYTPRNPLVTIALNEVRLTIRTPIYILNSYIGFIIVPLGLLAGRFLPVDLGQIRETLAPVDPRWVPFGIAGLFFGLTALSLLGSTAFSREGKDIQIARSLPIRGRDYLYGKAWGIAVSSFVLTLPSVILAAVWVGLGFFWVVAGLALGMLVIWAFNVWALLLDLKRPLLHWTDPARAIKQNFNSIIALFGGWGILALMTMGVFNSPLDLSLTLALLTLALGLVLWVGLKVVEKKADRWFADIQL